MRILITGATGFIGSRLVSQLAPTNEIFALVRRRPEIAEPNVRYVIQDLCLPLDRARLPSKLDAIIHQAAVIDTEDALSDRVPFEVNVIATWRLLEYAAAAEVDVFVHASTGGIYGCSKQPFSASI